MNLTAENYYTSEADIEYMSCSQYQGFLECEAKQLAKIHGRWEEEPSEALIVGNYFHTAFESAEAHQKFCDEHFNKIFKSKVNAKTGEMTVTGKYAPYETADRMIATAKRDPFIQKFINMQGEHERIMTGELFGVKWRIRIDKYVPDFFGSRLILDWKTTANIYETKYNSATKEHESFIDFYGYMTRAAVYAEIEKQRTGSSDDCELYIIAISKQDPCDKEILRLNGETRDRWDYELDKISGKIQKIQAIKRGEFLPLKCGLCDYCRSIKQITGIISYSKLNPGFRGEREEDVSFAR